MSKKMKKVLIVIAIILGVIICVGGFVIYNISQMPLPSIFQIDNIDFTKIANGSYIGYSDNGMIKAKVSVVVTDGKVTAIEILKHDNGLGRKAEAITTDVINAQSLEVDAISSATYSSSTILKAIEDALIQGVKEKLT